MRHSAASRSSSAHSAVPQFAGADEHQWRELQRSHRGGMAAWPDRARQVAGLLGLGDGCEVLAGLAPRGLRCRSAVTSRSASPETTGEPEYLPQSCLTRWAVSIAPRASSLRTTRSSTSRGPMVEMGRLPRKGKTSFSSHVFTFSCVMSAGRCRLGQPIRATTSKVLAAAPALACFFLSLGCAGVDPVRQLLAGGVRGARGPLERNSDRVRRQTLGRACRHAG